MSNAQAPLTTGSSVLRALVTGSNRGLGLGLCRALAERGDEVLAVCRRSSPELDGLDVTVVDGVDLTDGGATARIRAAIGPAPLDLVVANAVRNESFNSQSAEQLDLELFEGDLSVSVVGAIRTVQAVMPSLRPGSRIVLVSSGAARPGPPGPGSFGYKIAKAALNHFARIAAPELAARGVVVAAVCPGPTNTEMLRASYEAGIFAPTDVKDPDTSARRLLATAEAVPPEASGSYWSSWGEMYLTPEGVPPATSPAA